nr:hypothetical protein CFP56_09286 [Quercus suber]
MSGSSTTVHAPLVMNALRLTSESPLQDQLPGQCLSIMANLPPPLWYNSAPRSTQQSLVTGLEPPTKAKWEAYRPMITDLYKRKQHTARQIIEELKKHGFYATEKMLRDRFRAWEINNKNKNSKRPSVDESTSADDEIVKHPMVNIVQLGGIKYPVRAAPSDLATQRSMVAVSDWYDCILENREKAFSFWENPCPMFNVTSEFSVALYGLKESDFKFGWKKLRDIGSHIDDALRSSHSLSLIWLIANNIAWKCVRPEIVDAVRRFWALRSREILGARHPITIITAALCHRAVSEELCDQFFATIDSKLPDDTAISEQQLQVASQSQIVYGQVLIATQQHEKADAILENLAIKTASREAYVYQHPQVLRLQANSQKNQGNLRKADELFKDTHRKLKECGKENTGVTSISLIDRAKVKDALGELDECEDILYEVLRIQPLCTDSAMLQQPLALYHLHDVLRRRGKVEQMNSLEKSYAEAFESSGATEAIIE